MKHLYDVLILGGGPGGYTAALYAAREGLKTAVLEKLSAGGQMATTAQVDNYPGFDEGIDGFELAERMQRGAERFGAETLYAEVTALDLRAEPKRITTSDGELLAKTVLLATGASPRELGLPEEASLRGRGVSYCATCDGMFFRGKTVVVAGGGNSAVADALALSKLCKQVYLLHRRDTLRAGAGEQALLREAGNVSFLWNAKITKLLQENALTGIQWEDVTTGTVSRLDCDGVFVAIGRNPETALLKDQLELDEQGYLVADETTRTSIPGVFAVGDVRRKPLRQIITAAADGAVAATEAQKYLLTHA